MRFGLFGGARTEIGEQASDSQIYTDYIDYICEAEALGFHSVFLVEHHFTGFGQISAPLRKAAEDGFNLLLGQAGSPELVAENIGIYRKSVEAQGRRFDPMSVGLTRALHIAVTAEERDAVHELRMTFMRSVQQLWLSPTGEAPTLGRPRRAISAEDMHRATETDALIGTPDEIVGRIKQLQAGGVEYVMVIDVGGSLSALRTFAREVMPEFAHS